MKIKDMLVEFYEPEDDKMSVADISDVRRPRLTLRHIRKLRRMRDVRLEDKKRHDSIVSDVYASEEEVGAM